MLKSMMRRLRELRLAYEKNHGRQVSQTWGKKDKRTSRRKAKEKLRNIDKETYFEE